MIKGKENTSMVTCVTDYCWLSVIRLGTPAPHLIKPLVTLAYPPLAVSPGMATTITLVPEYQS